MKKSRGHSLIDFISISVLAIGIIICGIYKFGDDIANFFARSTPEQKFNNARIVRFEKPQDLISNVVVTFDGIPISPPVEEIIKQSLAAGTYIQTSGSAGRIAEMGKIMEQYITEIQKLTTTGVAGEAAFNTALDAYKDNLDKGDGTGFLEKYLALGANDILEKKLNFVEMSLSLGTTTLVSDISTALGLYLPNLLAPHPVRHDIVQTFTNDLLGFGNNLDYFIDPYLYPQYLGENKKNDATQDQTLMTAIDAAAGGMTQDEKQSLAGHMKVFYGGGYSKASPSAYNGERMCSTFAGVLVEPACTITGP